MATRLNLRRGDEAADADRLRALFNRVFAPESVGDFAATVFNHLPGVGPSNWFIAEKSRDEPVAAFALVPWNVEWEGVPLKVAEMGIVGTLEEYRGQGLQRRLNAEFDRALHDQGYDLAIIQGIPGFYGQFGFHYALPLENHINLPLHAVGETDPSWSFRLATQEDIPLLMREDAAYRAAFSLAVRRDEPVWRYMLGPSRDTEYGSEFWIMEKAGARFYCRMPREGFGAGLIVSEVSEGISAPAMGALLAFCRDKATERAKPYIRFNLHDDTAPGRLVRGAGAPAGTPYAWQVKVPDAARLLRTAAPVLERRLAGSAFAGLDGRLRLDFFCRGLDMVWEAGRLARVEAMSGEAEHRFCANTNLFAALCLGHRSWEELRRVQPDIFPAGGQAGPLVETLFAQKPAWLHQQY